MGIDLIISPAAQTVEVNPQSLNLPMALVK